MQPLPSSTRLLLPKSSAQYMLESAIKSMGFQTSDRIIDLQGLNTMRNIKKLSVIIIMSLKKLMENSLI